MKEKMKEKMKVTKWNVAGMKTFRFTKKNGYTLEQIRRKATEMSKQLFDKHNDDTMD